MKKLLTMITVLCMTFMLTGCTKTAKLENIDKANFTENILSIKCTNTLEEMMSENFEPKFKISNNYKEGDIPYLNFEFDKKDELNSFFKFEALTLHANHTANDINIKKGFEDGYYLRDELSSKTNTYNDRYLFINIRAINGTSNSNSYYICIDKENKKLLSKSEILNLKNYDINANKELLLDQIISKNTFTNNINKDDLFNLILKDKAEDYNYTPRELNLNEALIKAIDLNNGYCEDPFYDTTYIFLPSSENDLTLMYYINENDELMAYINWDINSDRPLEFNIKLCD